MYSAIQDRDQELKGIVDHCFPHWKQGNDGEPVNVAGYAGSFNWDNNIQALPVPETIKALIQYDPGKGTRSNGVMSVVNALVKADIKLPDIFKIFEEQAIGIKWRKEHRGKRKWLDRHIEKAVKRVSRNGQSSSGTTPGSSESRKYPLTDLGAAERFADNNKERARYCPQWKEWLTFNDTVWEIDTCGRIYQFGKDIARSTLAQASTITDDYERKALVKYALSLESRNRIEAMIHLASKEPGIPIFPNELDADDWLFNANNGTINLRLESSGSFYPHKRTDLITKRSLVTVDPHAKCDRWLEVLNRSFDGNDNLISFCKRAVGYSMTGDTREQCMFFQYGAGANGKSTFLEIIRALFGDYAKQTDFSTFLVKNSDGARNDLAALRGARFVSGVEVDSGKRVAEALIKQVTGGDVITARFLHKEFFEFKPTFKIWLAANHKPKIYGTDYAIWRRIRLIPFNITIPEEERDPDLLNKLRGELSGILNWALEGCMEWQENGLGVPEEVKDATNAYRAEMDPLSDFIRECCTLHPQAMVRSKELLQKYEAWCRDCGEDTIKPRKLGMALRERGLKDVQVGPERSRGWKGIGFRTDEQKRTEEPGFSIYENNMEQKP